MKLTPALLARLEPIRALSQPRLEELVDLCRVERHALGSDPLRNKSGVEFIYLLAGELHITLTDGSHRLLVGGCDLARWPIGYKTVLPLRSKAVTDVVLLRIDFDALDVIITWDQLTQRAEPSQTPLIPASSENFSARVLTSGALAQLPPAHIQELLGRFVRVPVRAGQTVIHEGESGSDYFIIEFGRCEVRKLIGGANVLVAELKAGDVFGEEALLADMSRGASVIMKTDGMLLRLSKPDFVELLQTPLLHAIDRNEAERLIAQGTATWLDIRYPAEFNENGLPGAINLPLDEIRKAYELLDKHQVYIVYCQSGRRSSAGAFLLAQHGFRAFVLEGGLGLAGCS